MITRCAQLVSAARCRGCGTARQRRGLFRLGQTSATARGPRLHVRSTDVPLLLAALQPPALDHSNAATPERERGPVEDAQRPCAARSHSVLPRPCRPEHWLTASQAAAKTLSACPCNASDQWCAGHSWCIDAVSSSATLNTCRAQQAVCAGWRQSKRTAQDDHIVRARAGRHWRRGLPDDGRRRLHLRITQLPPGSVRAPQRLGRLAPWHALRHARGAEHRLLWCGVEARQMTQASRPFAALHACSRASMALAGAACVSAARTHVCGPLLFISCLQLTLACQPVRLCAQPLTCSGQMQRVATTTAPAAAPT